VTQTFNIKGMTCGHCEGRVTSEILTIPGVTEVIASAEKANVTVDPCELQCLFSLHLEGIHAHFQTRLFSVGIDPIRPLNFCRVTQGYKSKMASRTSCCTFSTF